MSSALGRAPAPDPQRGGWGSPDYPPQDHFLRDLGVTVELHPDGTARGAIPIGPDVLLEDGHPRAGIVGVLVDSVAGAVAVMSARPERVATADMAMHLLRPVRYGLGSVLTVEATVTRRGRTTVVIEATVRDGPEAGPVDGPEAGPVDGPEAGPVGWATLTFALLPAREHQLTPGGQLRLDEVVRTEFGAGSDRRSVLERIGFAPRTLEVDGVGGVGGRVAVVSPGDVVSLEVVDYVRNTFGAVQGGIVTLMVDEAARRAVPGAAVVDLHLAFLAPCKEGPIVGRADVLEAPGAGPGTVLVELRDVGAGDRVTTIADVGMVPTRVGVSI